MESGKRKGRRSGREICFREKPQILLLGNGVNRAFCGHAISWDDLLKKGTEGSHIPDDLKMPYSLQIVLRTGDNVNNRMRARSRELYGVVDSPEMCGMLCDLMALGCDDILTSNYSYELEEAALGVRKLTPSGAERLMRHTDMVSRAEAKYLLHTYNEVTCKDKTCRIWHIHGEARKHDSMVIGHYYYGLLLAKYMEYLKERVKAYHNWQTNPSFHFESWIDKFILGDVYVVGFGFDYAELDLWWLLNRKKLEKNPHGGFYYYEPKKQVAFHEKTELLKVYGAEVLDLGFTRLPRLPEGATSEQKQIREERNCKMYREFYREALKDIKNKMTHD